MHTDLSPRRPRTLALELVDALGGRIRTGTLAAGDKLPTPWRVCTRPAACSLEIASRTTVRLTPNSSMIAASVGSFSPVASEPSRMRPVSASTTSWARLRGRRRTTSFIGKTLSSHQELSGHTCTTTDNR